MAYVQSSGKCSCSMARHHRLFKQRVGVKQGCILSPDLFKIYLKHIMREALEEHQNTGAGIGGTNINNLRFADDIDLIARKLKELQDELLNKVDEISTKYGLEISETKTEWMRMEYISKKKKEAKNKDEQEQNEQNDNQEIEQLLLKGLPLKKVEKFKYLGATITEDGESLTDITIRTATALNVMSSLNKIWKSSKALTKVRLYKSLIQPIALYGCEPWTLKKREWQKLSYKRHGRRKQKKRRPMYELE